MGAVDAGLIVRSPCTLKGAGTERHAEMQIATPEQVAELAAAVGPRWEALVFVAAYTSLRWGELSGLRRSDVDVGANLVTVRRKLGEVNGTLSFSPPKTAAGKRTIGIRSFVARSLAVHRTFAHCLAMTGSCSEGRRSADAAEQLPPTCGNRRPPRQA